MSELQRPQNEHRHAENGNGKPAVENGRHSIPLSSAQDSKLTIAELQEVIRTQKKTILDQSQRIEELESYLACIVSLAAKVKELELDRCH